MRNHHLIAFTGVLLVAGLANAGPITLYGNLSGANENPPKNVPGTGTVQVTFDPATNLLSIQTVFSGLTSGVTGAHIHCCVAPPGNTGVATPLPAFPGFPLGSTSGTYSGSLNLTLSSSYNPTFLSGFNNDPLLAEAALVNGLTAGQTYFNIHTTNNPGGEIRAFLATPEPGTLTLAGLAVAGLSVLRRRKRA